MNKENISIFIGKIAIVAIMLIVCACTKNKKRNYIYTYNNLINNQIAFYNDAVFVNSDLDTVKYSLNGKIKIVNYIDSTGCLSCRLKLSDWNTFMNKFKDYDDLKLITIINPRKSREATYVIQRDNFEYPVCIDMENIFFSMNELPHNNSFHCFLLDENNRIVLIGNPIQNPKIRDLYIRTICERLGVKPNLNAVSKPHNQSKSLGSFNWQTEQHTTFSIHNTGNEPMLIDTIFTSCECTTAEIDKRSIEPADSAIVSIRFKAEKPEQFMREVYVGVQGKETIVFSIEGGAME